jgi:hypothetical protein
MAWIFVIPLLFASKLNIAIIHKIVPSNIKTIIDVCEQILCKHKGRIIL